MPMAMGEIYKLGAQASLLCIVGLAVLASWPGVSANTGAHAKGHGGCVVSWLALLATSNYPSQNPGQY